MLLWPIEQAFEDHVLRTGCMELSMLRSLESVIRVISRDCHQIPALQHQKFSGRDMVHLASRLPVSI